MNHYVTHYVHGKPCEVGGSFRMSPHALVVAMHEVETERNGILLPADVAMQMRSDAGTVVGAGAETGLAVGDVVVVQYGGGKRVLGWECDGWACEDLRFYGVVGGTLIDRPDRGDEATPRRVDSGEYVIAMVKDNGLRAMAGYCLLELPEAPEESDGGILISARSRKLPPTATVYSAGAGTGYEDGDEVVYHQGAAYGHGSGRLIKWDGKTLLRVSAEEIYGAV